MKKFHLSLISTSLIIFIAMFSFVSAEEQAVKNKPVKAVYSGDKVITYEQLCEKYDAVNKSYISSSRGRSISFPELEIINQDTFIKEAVAKNIIEEKALKEKLQDTDEFKKTYAKEIYIPLSELLYKDVILNNMSEPTEKEIQECYVANIESFTSHFTFWMKHLFLSTYKEYTVKKGDTLKSIAEKESGDPAKATLIMNKNRKIIAENVEDLDKKEVNAGDKLFVPMNEEEVENVKKKMEKIKTEVTPENFDDMIIKYSETEKAYRGLESPPLTDAPMLGQGQKPVLPELVEYAKKTPAGGIGDILQTKHGFQIIKITRKVEGGVKPIEEVKDQMLPMVKGRREKALVGEYVNNLKNAPFFEKHYDVLKNKDAKDSDVLVKIGDLKYTLGEFNEEMKKMQADNKSTTNTYEQNVNILDNRFVNDLIAEDAKIKGLDKTEEGIIRIEELKRKIFFDKYINEAFNKVNIVNDENLKKYYDDKKKAQYTAPTEYTLHIISKNLTIPSDASKKDIKNEEKKILAQLKEVKRQIKNTQDFEKLAKEESQDYAKEKGGLIGPTNSRFKGAAFEKILLELKKGEITEPFMCESVGYIVQLDEIKTSTPPPFEEVKERLKYDYQSELHTKTKLENVEKLCKEVKLKIKR